MDEMKKLFKKVGIERKIQREMTDTRCNCEKSPHLRWCNAYEKVITERGELIDFFLREINVERQGTKYPSLTPKLVAIKVGHIPTKDLYALKSKMLDAQRRNFPVGVVFFTETKTMQMLKITEV